MRSFQLTLDLVAGAQRRPLGFPVSRSLGRFKMFVAVASSNYKYGNQFEPVLVRALISGGHSSWCPNNFKNTFLIWYTQWIDVSRHAIGTVKKIRKPRPRKPPQLMQLSDESGDTAPHCGGRKRYSSLLSDHLSFGNLSCSIMWRTIMLISEIFTSW